MRGVNVRIAFTWRHHNDVDGLIAMNVIDVLAYLCVVALAYKKFCKGRG